MQLDVALKLGKKYVLYIVENERLPTPNTACSNGVPNAFSILMSNSKTFQMPKKPDGMGKKIIAPQTLYTDLIDWARSIGSGWPADVVDVSGKQVMKSLSNSLWYINDSHAKFKDAGCPIPKDLDDFQHYNNYKALRHRPPIVRAERLQELVEDLASALCLPSMSEKRNKTLALVIEELSKSMNKYRERLQSDNEKHKNTYQSRDKANSGDSSSSVIEPVEESNVKEEYKMLNETMKGTPDYTFIQLDNFCPDNRIERRKYLKNLRLSKHITLYRVAYGGSIGTLSFIWSVPPGNTSDRMNQCMRVISEISDSLPKFSCRALRKEFIEKYVNFVKCPKSILRHMYFSLTGYEESANCMMEREINERVSKIISADDTQLLLDLRATNGSDSYYDGFFDEMGKYFDEQILQVNERRKSEEMYMPFAISIDTLKNEIAKRVPDGTPIPSNETIRLQFSPSNPFHSTALKYTGKFNVKFRVQTRQARVSHQDSHYAAKYFMYLKEFCVKFRENSMFLCMDDKAIIPVGEPGIPISTGVKGHDKVLAPTEGPLLVATDHDFHLGGLVASVVFVTDIPEDPKDSFFSGDMHVRTKDKVFSPSSPLRHGAELIKLLRHTNNYSEDEVNLSVPKLCLYTDGGPDHRVTYETVKLSLALLFMHLDLDMIIALRTAPSHSWTNPAERCMSILNLALQHVALDRDEMESQYVKMVKNLSTLSSVRNQAKLKTGLKEAFEKSMESVVDKVNERFSQMTLKGNKIMAHKGLSDEEVLAFLDITAIGLGADSPVATLNTKNTECRYCLINPVRDQDLVDRLSYLPEPTPDDSVFRYCLSFAQNVFGKPLTRDKYRPSLKKHGDFDEESEEDDKQNRDIFKVEKVRDAVLCGECHKPRCVFSAKTLDRQQLFEIKHYLKRKPSRTSRPAKHIPVGINWRKHLDCMSVSCISDVEISYFSAKCRHYLPPVCVYCGNTGELLDDNDLYIADLYGKYSVVRPLCSTCRGSGKDAKTWGIKK
ncbi:hypothetical protein MAR_021144, partial [Mya arenaria]